MIEIRVRAQTQAGRFHRGPLRLDDRWSAVDLERPEIRDALAAAVGVQVRVHPNDRTKIEAAGFRWRDGRLVDTAKLDDIAQGMVERADLAPEPADSPPAVDADPSAVIVTTAAPVTPDGRAPAAARAAGGRARRDKETRVRA